MSDTDGAPPVSSSPIAESEPGRARGMLRRLLADQPDAKPRLLPGKVTTMAALAVLSGCLTAVALGHSSSVNPVSTSTPLLSVGAVSATDAAVYKTAALSCPTLSAAKLAAQLEQLKASGAKMSTAEWAKWAPWPGAKQTDAQAEVLAVAHQTCDLVGQLRVAKVAGDPWRTAVAASYLGLASVTAAHGIPAAAQTYLSAVAGYADLYAAQNVFGGTGALPQAAAVVSSAKPAASAAQNAAASAAPASTPAAAPATSSQLVLSATPSLSPAVQPVSPSAASSTAAPAPPATSKPPSAAAPPAAAPPAASAPQQLPLPNGSVSGVPVQGIHQVVLNGLALDVPGANNVIADGTALQLSTNSNSQDQHWDIDYDGNGFWLLVNAYSGKALTVRGGSRSAGAVVEQDAPNTADVRDEWQIRDAGNGSVVIVNRNSGMALQASGSSIVQQPVSGAANQRWQLVV